MVTKNRSKKQAKSNLSCKTRQEWYDWYDDVVPGWSKKPYYERIYARDPKTRKWVRLDEWDTHSIGIFEPKSTQLKARKIPPYDSLPDYAKDFVGREYHIYSEKDRQRFNRSIVALPMTLSKKWDYTQEVLRKAPKLRYSRDVIYSETLLDHLMRERERRNRSKHPLLRR